MMITVTNWSEWPCYILFIPLASISEMATFKNCLFDHITRAGKNYAKNKIPVISTVPVSVGFEWTPLLEEFLANCSVEVKKFLRVNMLVTASIHYKRERGIGQPSCLIPMINEWVKRFMAVSIFRCVRPTIKKCLKWKSSPFSESIMLENRRALWCKHCPNMFRVFSEQKLKFIFI